LGRCAEPLEVRRVKQQKKGWKLKTRPSPRGFCPEEFGDEAVTIDFPSSGIPLDQLRVRVKINRVTLDGTTMTGKLLIGGRGRRFKLRRGILEWQQSRCGDGVVAWALGEQCDDGNTNNTDVCIIGDLGGPAGSTNCVVARCGDGSRCSDPSCVTGPNGGPEVCDPSEPDGPECSSDCAPPPNCGNGVVEGAEACDDAGESGTCDGDCTAVECGDTTTNEAAGEQCDAGPANSDTAPNACRTDCRLAYCGDAVGDPANAETCDPPGDDPDVNDGSDNCGCCQDQTNHPNIIGFWAGSHPDWTCGDCHSDGGAGIGSFDGRAAFAGPLPARWPVDATGTDLRPLNCHL
jgi:cysteine-rich repeat protein